MSPLVQSLLEFMYSQAFTSDDEDESEHHEETSTKGDRQTTTSSSTSCTSPFLGISCLFLRRQKPRLPFVCGVCHSYTLFGSFPPNFLHAERRKILHHPMFFLFFSLRVSV